MILIAISQTFLSCKSSFEHETSHQAQNTSLTIFSENYYA